MAKKKKTKASSKSNLAAALSQTSARSSGSSMMAMKQMSMQALVMTTVLWFIAHSGIIFLANSWYPSSVVVGTHLISPMMGILYSMVVFTLLTVGAIPVIELIAAQLRWRMSNLHWFAAFVVVNTAALWLVARFAEQLGLGLSSWTVALVLAVIMDLVQGFLVQVANRD